MRAKGSWTRKLKEKGAWGLLNTSNKQLHRSNYREQRLSKGHYFLLTHQQTTSPVDSKSGTSHQKVFYFDSNN